MESERGLNDLSKLDFDLTQLQNKKVEFERELNGFFFSTWFNFERGYSSVLDRRLHYLGLWSLHNKFDERSVIIKLHQTTQTFIVSTHVK